MPRWMTAEREVHIRAGIAMSTTPDEEDLLVELDAERAVSKALATALLEMYSAVELEGANSLRFHEASNGGRDALARYREGL